MVYWLLTQTVSYSIITTVVNNRHQHDMSIQDNEHQCIYNISMTSDKCTIHV